MVIEKVENDLNIITAFPGPYDPSFPYEGQIKADHQLSEIFWNTHVLLRVKDV